MFVGLTPGLTGVYQVSFRVPMPLVSIVVGRAGEHPLLKLAEQHRLGDLLAQVNV